MNAKQTKTLKILVGIIALLLVVLAAVLLINRNRDAAQEGDSSQESLSGGETAYTDLTFTNDTSTVSLAVNEEGAWYWVDDPDFPVSETAVTRITNTLAAITPEQTITEGDTLDAYGLEDPAATVRATTAAGGQVSFAVGNAVTGSESRYALFNGDESTVYIISGNLYSLLSVGVYDMMDLPDLPVLPAERIDSISISGQVSTVLTAAVSVPEGGSSADSADVTVSWRSGGANVTDNDDAQNIVSDVSVLSLTRCEVFKPTVESASLCGFDAPQASLTVDYTDDAGAEQTLSLTIGGTTAAGDGHYVRLEGDDTIYSMSSDSLANLLKVADGGLSA